MAAHLYFSKLKYVVRQINLEKNNKISYKSSPIVTYADNVITVPRHVALDREIFDDCMGVRKGPSIKKNLEWPSIILIERY